MRRYNFFILCLFLCVFASCKSTKQLTDKSTIQERTQTTEQMTSHSDSVSVEQVSSEATKEHSVSTDETTIVFAPNGGSYNVNTGQADNVISVSKNAKIEALKEQLSKLQTTIDSQEQIITTLSDSVSFLNQQNDIDSLEKTEGDSWYKWLLAGIAIGVILIIFVKKFPYTKPFFFWL